MIHPSRDGETIEDFARAGREAGKKAAAEFRRLHPIVGIRDPGPWLEQLEVALVEACTQMLASGAEGDQLDAWRDAFDAAMRPAIEAWDFQRPSSRSSRP